MATKSKLSLVEPIGATSAVRRTAPYTLPSTRSRQNQGASYRGTPNEEAMGSVEQQIRSTAAQNGAADLADLLVAIGTKESGLKPDNPGDYDKNGVSRSDGVYQENDGGRGHGLSVAQKRDVPASTLRAIAEIRQTQKANPGADLGTIAIKAQRPREDLQPAYRAEINRLIKQAGATKENGLGPAGRAIAQGVNKAFNGKYSLPVDGTLTNAWGGKQTYSAGMDQNIGGFNHGADLAVPAGTTVRAPVGGVVKSVYNTQHDDRKGERVADENSGWGGQVVLMGDDGKLHRLDHAQFGSIQVQPGQRVEQGQPTHKVGVSGNSTGPHVDWEKWSVDAKGNPVTSEDPLAAPTVAAKDAQKAYDAAFSAARAQRTQASGDSGDTTVAETATTRDTPTDLESYFTRIIPTRTDAKAVADKALSDLDLRLADLKRQQDAVLKLPNVGGDLVKAGKQPGFTARAEEISRIEGTPGTADKGTRVTAKTAAEEAAAALDEANKGLSAESTRRKSSGATADSLAKDQADLETARFKLEELKARAATGGISPAEYADTMSQIKTREEELRLRGQALVLDRARVGNETRKTTSDIERQGVQSITDMAKLPYDIEGMIASADLTTEQANELRAFMPLKVKQYELELQKGYALLPSDIAQGAANADLTRQQADRYRQLMGPEIQEFADKHHLSEASTTRLIQLLPYELAKTQADTKLTLAQTGLTGAQAELAQTEVAVAKEAAAGRKRVEDWIRANPNATDEDIDAVVVREATNLQDRIAARGIQLKAKADKEAKDLGIQQRQIEQQKADTDQASASERGIADYMTAGASQSNAFTNAVVAPVGPARRMAQALAMAPMIGEKGLEGALTGMNFGQPEYEAARELAKNYGNRISTIQGRAGDAIRRAPTITTPAPEKSEPAFRPPTSSPQATASPQATGLPNPTTKPPDVNVDLSAASTASQAPPLGMNDHPDEQATIAGVTGGPAAGTMYPDEAAGSLDTAPVGAVDETDEERRRRFYGLSLDGASVNPGLAGAGLGLGGGGVPQPWWPNTPQGAGGGGGNGGAQPWWPGGGGGSPSLAQGPQLNPFTSLPPVMSPMNPMSPMARMHPMAPMSAMNPMAKMAPAPGAERKLLPNYLAGNFGQFAPQPTPAGGGGGSGPSTIGGVPWWEMAHPEPAPASGGGGMPAGWPWNGTGGGGSGGGTPANALTGGEGEYATDTDLEALQQAVAQADPDEVRRTAALAFAGGKISKRDYDQLCQQFVENAYGTGFGTPSMGQFPSAKAAATGLGATPGDPAAAKKGDLVFFKPDASNNQYGHVGLADPEKGPGAFVSATASGVKNDNYLNDPYWKSLYSGTAAPPPTWKGRSADSGGGGLGMSGGAPTRWWLINGEK